MLCIGCRNTDTSHNLFTSLAPPHTPPRMVPTTHRIPEPHKLAMDCHRTQFMRFAIANDDPHSHPTLNVCAHALRHTTCPPTTRPSFQTCSDKLNWRWILERLQEPNIATCAIRHCCVHRRQRRTAQPNVVYPSCATTWPHDIGHRCLNAPKLHKLMALYTCCRNRPIAWHCFSMYNE